MKKFAGGMLFVGALAVGAVAAYAEGYPADNSGKNHRDRAEKAVTPGDQSSTESDLAITQAIRKDVLADDALSINAHNVKIITASGIVTLRGPVKSAGEKANIGVKAGHAKGVKGVDNQIEIASE